MLTATEAEQGACFRLYLRDPELYQAFWDEKSGKARAKAKAVCATCPVIDRCLEEALADNEVFGIWAGTGRRDREVLRRDIRNAVG